MNVSFVILDINSGCKWVGGSPTHINGSRIFNLIDAKNKDQPIFIEEKEEQEPSKIEDLLINDLNQRNNNNNNSSNNSKTVHSSSKRTLRNRRPAPVINHYPERDTLGINTPKRNKKYYQEIPTTVSQFFMVEKQMC